MTDLLYRGVQVLAGVCLAVVVFWAFRTAAGPVIAEVRGRLATRKAWRDWRRHDDATRRARKVGR